MHRFNSFHIIITVSKARLHGEFARKWRKGFMTRPNMSMKWC